MTHSPEEIWQATAADLTSWYSAGSTTPSEVADAILARIVAADGSINAIMHVDSAAVRERAEYLGALSPEDRKVLPLYGVPVTVKDLVAVKGQPLTFGIRSFEDNIADHTDGAVCRLLDAGAIIVGHTNTSEGGYAAVSSNGLFGRTENPWRLGYNAGGSSGGAAAAVASGFGPLAVGSDGGGSVRLPASLCGVVGFKPSRGVIPFESSFWSCAVTLGPLGRTVADVRLMTAVMSGQDSSDPFSGSGRVVSPIGSPDPERRMAGLRVGVVRDFGLGQVDEEVWDRVLDTARILEQVGAQVSEVDVDWSGAEEAMWHAHWLPLFTQIAEAFGWYEVSPEVEPELGELIDEGLHLDARQVARAEMRCRQLAADFSQLTESWDVILSPVACTPAFPNHQFAPAHLVGAPLRTRLLGWLLTYPFNVLGAPGLSLPSGLSRDGLPIGVQIVSNAGRDDLVLDVGAVLEAHLPRQEVWAASAGSKG